MELLQSEPALFVGLVFLFSLMVGSFLNVVIHRLPRMMEADWHAQCAALKAEDLPETPAYTLWKPRSACPHCGHQITPMENIPVLSWLWLRGRCSACTARISARYPAVELLTAALSALVAWKFGFGLAALGGIAFIWMLVVLAFIDLDTTYLPDDLTLPLLWGGVLLNLFGTFTSLPSAVVGAMAGYLSLWSVYWVFKLVTGKEGMGYGDFKLLAAIGAWLGWELLPVTILLSSVVGAAVGIAMIVLVKHDHRIPIPFGPYLAGGGVVALFFGADINQAWLGNL
jgi:leader peptidase (prepilin peptidase) / N-methyltransferase